MMLFMSGTLLSFFLLFGLAPIHEAQEASSSSMISPLSVGSSLSANAATSWLSRSGRFSFGFYPEGEGFFIGIQLLVSPSETRVVWTARLDLKPFSKDASIKFTTDGLLLTPARGTPSFPLFNLTVPASSAAMLDNGNFVVYSLGARRPDAPTIETTNPLDKPGSVYGPSGGSRDCSCSTSTDIIWRSFDFPTDTILGSQSLPCDHNLTSSAGAKNHSIGAYVLSMPCNGNLVCYPVNSVTAQWDSGASGANYGRLVLTENGLLYLSAVSGRDKELSGYKPQNNSAGMIYAATLDPDSVFRLYAVNLDTNLTQPVNEIPYLKDGCQAKDICGVNSYCLLAQNKPKCYCMQGFEYMNGSEVVAGCRRNLVLPSCKIGSGAGNLAMQVVNNIVGLDELAYSVVPAATSDDCSNDCVNDCDCYAAVFRDQKCSKLKLPLTGGRMDANDPSVAFVKLAVEAGADHSGTVRRKRVRVVAIIVCVIFAGFFWLAVIVACGGAYWHLFGRCRQQWEKWELAFSEDIAPRSFKYDEIPINAKNFVGEGGHGKVFEVKVRIGGDEPVSVAVKLLHGLGGDAEKDFKAEMSLIGRARHRNVVRILGFCHDDFYRLLIYEFMSRGSLDKLIFKNLQQRLPWSLRVSLLLGAARGIHYLHCECEEAIIHRDIKPENILISEDWTAKISDFGLARLVSPDKTRVDTLTIAAGTDGYVAPECRQVDPNTGTIALTEKVDVYSYGVVLLETVCSKRDVNFRDLVSLYDAGQLSTLLDGEQVDASELEMVVKVGIMCVRENPQARPSMEEVVLMLEEVVPE